MASRASDIATDFPRAWQVGPGRALPLDAPVLMGIVNATPDSFSDGGRGRAALVAHARRLVDEGAAIIDVGGESTRPGAARVAAAEQIDRVRPVVEAAVSAGAIVSIDTTRAEVAAAALDAGATIVNDVAAGLEDDELLPLVAARGAGLVLMHRRLPPERDAYSHQYRAAPRYDDVVADVAAFLLERVAAAEAAGVARAAIAIDPGLGFGKSVGQNYTLIARAAELARHGLPLVAAASRKSFIGHVSGVAEPAARLAGSLAVSVVLYQRGARIFRVHDVAAHREALAVAAAAAAAG